ncbi:hypothetical protein BJ742DRAFT_779343 [Cladochytrium replicatum]|nr:hypothetical protein BJ742DRAFT_779343 [Cladochytrium replicatum]
MLPGLYEPVAERDGVVLGCHIPLRDMVVAGVGTRSVALTQLIAARRSWAATSNSLSSSPSTAATQHCRSDVPSRSAAAVASFILDQLFGLATPVALFQGIESVRKGATNVHIVTGINTILMQASQKNL